MATSQPAKAEKKPKVGGTPRFNHCPSFNLKKPSFTAPLQGLEYIIFDNMGTAKVASTFNLNLEANSEHVVNRLKFDGPLVALAIRELREPTIAFPDDLEDSSNLVEMTK